MGYASMLSKDIQPLMPALQSFWLQLHVFTAIFSYGAFGVSFALAILYLVTGGRDAAPPEDAEQKPAYPEAGGSGEGKGLLNWIIPVPRVIDRLIYGTAAFGFTFLTMVLITGAVWAEEVWGRWWGWDPKETWALITWIIYLFYLHARLSLGWHGRRGAWLACLGFVAVLFTLIGVTYLLPGLHSYK